MATDRVQAAIGDYMGVVDTTEREALRQAVRKVLKERSPLEATRRIAATPEPIDRVLWRYLARDLGVVSLLAPEEYGGANASFDAAGVVIEELGRSLSCVPFISTAVLAVTALRGCDDEEAKAQLLPPIARGDSVASVVLPQPQPLHRAPVLTTQASAQAGQWLLHGSSENVLDAAIADVLIVPAESEEGIQFFAVYRAAANLSVVPHEAFDATRPQARVTFEGSPACRITDGQTGTTLLRQLYDVAFTALASDQLGVAVETLTTASEYAKTRIQFGRRIGSYQAIMHRCADMLVASEAARSAVYHALGSLVTTEHQRAIASSVAKAACDESALLCAESNIQVHGGIGCTWEHPAHLFLRRAKSTSMLLGSSTFHRRRLAELVDLDLDVAART